MKFHIGKQIAQIIAQRGMKKSEFAKRINRSRQNVEDILKRESIDTELLFAISSVLNYDFFNDYSEALNLPHTEKSVQDDVFRKLLYEINKLNKKLM